MTETAYRPDKDPVDLNGSRNRRHSLGLPGAILILARRTIFKQTPNRFEQANTVSNPGLQIGG